MSKLRRSLTALVLATLLLTVVATPAMAFEGREGDTVTVPASETIDDDLYVGASNFTMDGTVNGDVVAGGQIVTINGTVNGNLLTGAQTIVVNGTVTGDILAGGSVLFFGENARIGGDVLAAGYSLEFREGSRIERDAVLAGGQVLLAADVTRNVLVGTGALEIAGEVGGDVKAAVGEAGQTQAGPPPTMFMPDSTIPVPVIKQGLTIDPAARIRGNLEYTQNSELQFPAGVVEGKITRSVQPVEGEANVEPTTADKVSQWALQSLRSLVTLILLGLLLVWLVPGFLRRLTEGLEAKPLQSLGWGVIAYAGFFFLLMLTVFLAILGAIVFGVLTLSTLSATIVWVAILALFALILGFVLVTSFLSKIVFGMTIGKWILSKANSQLAENRYWPMVIGVAITVIVLALLRFPLMPGFLGGLISFAIVLMGLGTLWLWIQQMRSRKGPADIQPAQSSS